MTSFYSRDIFGFTLFSELSNRITRKKYLVTGDWSQSRSGSTLLVTNPAILDASNAKDSKLFEVEISVSAHCQLNLLRVSLLFNMGLWF